MDEDADFYSQSRIDEDSLDEAAKDELFLRAYTGQFGNIPLRVLLFAIEYFICVN